MTKMPKSPMRRSVLGGVTAVLAAITGCARANPDQRNAPDRFKGVGCVLVVDAVPGTEMLGVEFFDDRGYVFYASSTVARRKRDILALGGARIPLAAHVTWRDNPKPIRGKNGGIAYEGPIAGDYTIPIAERIPDEVLANIRAHGGALRLKFRLKPDGVMFGWDIERDGIGTPYPLKYDLPGGDFKEAFIVNGKAAIPGWYVAPDGRKVETDY
jgi:hypothetical protein